MKKIFIGLMMTVMAGCSYYMKGDYTLGKRNAFNDFFYTYNIHFFGNDEFSDVDTETVTETDFEAGIERHAIPGGKVVSSRVYTKKMYTDEIVRPNVRGALVSYRVPVELSDEKVYKIIGETEIEGKTYRLVEPNRIGDIVLIDSRGEIFKRVGRIYNDRLALLRNKFSLEPANLKFINDVEIEDTVEREISSYVVRYLGIDNYQLLFEYKHTSPDAELSVEETKEFRFPMYDKTVQMGDLKLEILNVSESGIDYKILP